MAGIEFMAFTLKLHGQLDINYIGHLLLINGLPESYSGKGSLYTVEWTVCDVCMYKLLYTVLLMHRYIAFPIYIGQYQ